MRRRFADDLRLAGLLAAKGVNDIEYKGPYLSVAGVQSSCSLISMLYSRMLLDHPCFGLKPMHGWSIIHTDVHVLSRIHVPL
jgi:hypothetical protein